MAFEIDWGQAVSVGTDLLKSFQQTKTATTQANTASATANAANANLQAQLQAQQNLQNQLLLASTQKSQPATTTNNKTIMWVSIGVGAVLLITVVIVLLAKRS